MEQGQLDTASYSYPERAVGLLHYFHLLIGLSFCSMTLGPAGYFWRRPTPTQPLSSGAWGFLPKLSSRSLLLIQGALFLSGSVPQHYLMPTHRKKSGRWRAIGSAHCSSVKAFRGLHWSSLSRAVFKPSLPKPPLPSEFQ